ncbi:MAG: thiamine pyrophosphate-binding protein, partial [Rhodospirillaceae bacterium]|nr:thiamine pyrophosphate-binding protein [Rhodospirillaceae bacterium]MDD9997140.1 thiamine pyrophosphate-binding protein [Rhodospirillaceae bacterium]MDE0360547.1 thiamine pyrophosphate-binding protein [Rhodospirillaceae bacterium]
MADPTVASVFLNTLKKHHVRHVFGVPTIQLGMMQDGFGKDPWFNFLTARHEESLGHMANGVAKTSNELAVCFATVGTGVANMVPGVAAAASDRVPMIALTSNNHLRLIEPPVDYIQTIRPLDLFRPITKWQAGLRQAERTVEVLEKAIFKSRSGCPGPVQVDVPFDLHTMHCDLDPSSTAVPEVPRPAPSSGELDQLMEMLYAAKKPLIIAGGGVARSRAVDDMREFVRRSGAAAITTTNGFGSVAEDCPTLAGNCGFWGGHGVVQACQEADLIVSFGCRFGLLMPVNKPGYPQPASQKLVQIDIDHGQIGETVNANLGIVADAQQALRAINGELAENKLNVDAAWVRSVVSARKRFVDECAELADKQFIEGTNTLNESAIARAVIRSLPDDAIVSVDGGQCVEWSTTWSRPIDPYHFVSNAGMAHLGAGLPMAIGAKVANPGKAVVALVGDGALGMTIQELETASRYNLSIVVVVFNDAKWGMYERPNRAIFKNDNFGTTLSRSNYASVAEGLIWIDLSIITTMYPTAS